MIDAIKAMFMERRKHVSEFEGEERRRPTRDEANKKLNSAIDDFSETILLSPCKLKRLLDKVTKQ